jgi:hypothetical protein
MQNALIQDTNLGATSLLRIVVIDIASGEVKHQYAYLLTTGSGVSEIVALNDHEFIVDERDGHGLGDQSKAKIKQLFKIDLCGAVDITGMNGTDASTHGVKKTLFLDLVEAFKANGLAADQIPAKIEGLSFGPDIKVKDTNVHTLWVANDNDFLSSVLDDNGKTVANPNQIFVFGFTDADLDGSKYVPQQFRDCR